jgi:L-alanine-DL-glutamate epimerase-like enolase superfamily enzyme
MDLRVESLRVPLRQPLRASWGTLQERVLFIVTLTGEDGAVGFGEAAPLEPYDGVSAGAVVAALDAYADVVRDLPEQAPGNLMLDACRRAADLPQALAAVDMALWDRAGRRSGRPVAALLTDRPADEVPVNATIGATEPGDAAVAVRRAVEAGFRCVKVKVGVGGIDADVDRVVAVRAAGGRDLAIRLDANGAWTVSEAIAAIERLSAVGLELVEEPVHGIAALREVREAVATRVAMDETAGEIGAIGAGAADAVCLKVSRAGGISGLLAQASLVRAAGGDPYVASTFDGPLGIAAAVHAAAALNLTTPCGLATLTTLELEAPPALLPRAGSIVVPPGPGLGVTSPA